MTSVGHSRWPRQTGLWVALFTVALLLRTGMVFYVNQSYNT